MAFPGKFELYDEAIKHPDGGFVLNCERYDYQVDIGIKEGKECFTVRYTGDDVKEHILEHNNAEYHSLLKTFEIIKADLEELPDSPKIKKQSKIISDYIAAFKYWFRNNGQTPRRFTIEDQSVEIQDSNDALWSIADDMRARKDAGEFQTYRAAYKWAEYHMTHNRQPIRAYKLERAYHKAKSEGRV